VAVEQVEVASQRLAELLDRTNTAGGVWADTAYRSRRNEDLLRQRMLTSHIHRKKPTHRPMPAPTARANAKKSVVRAHIEHVFADQKARMGLFVRTIGLARATTKIGLANPRPQHASPALAGASDGAPPDPARADRQASPGSVTAVPPRTSATSSVLSPLARTQTLPETR
jgi:hypothetical protein